LSEWGIVCVGNCPSGELYVWGIVRVGNCMCGELSEWGIVQWGIVRLPPIYYRIINYPHGCQLKVIHEIQNLLRRFYPHKQFMYYFNFCTVRFFTPFTNFNTFNKDVYPENTTVIK